MAATRARTLAFCAATIACSRQISARIWTCQTRCKSGTGIAADAWSLLGGERVTIVPTLSWAQPSSYRFCFKGIPKHSTVATSTVGVARDKDAQKVWHDGMREAMKRLEPSLGAAFLLPIRDETCR